MIAQSVLVFAILTNLSIVLSSNSVSTSKYSAYLVLIISRAKFIPPPFPKLFFGIITFTFSNEFSRSFFKLSVIALSVMIIWYFFGIILRIFLIILSE